MSDDTQHHSQESVHTKKMSAMPLSTVTITIDSGDNVRTASFRVPKDQFNLRPIPQYTRGQEWDMIVRPSRVDFELTAQDLIADEDGHYLAWTKSE